MSGGKKKKSSSVGGKNSNSNSSSNSQAVEKNFQEKENIETNNNNINTNTTTNNTKGKDKKITVSQSPEVEDNFANGPGVDVLDRLAPPILFFPPNVSEEYLNRFCPPVAVAVASRQENSNKLLLADEGFPDREIPVMRRLLAMMAGIMSKASAASARAYYSRVSGSEGRRNGLFQQNLNTSVFNLFSTLSAAGNTGPIPLSSTGINGADGKDLHLTPAAAFTAKDGEPLRGYSSRLMKFWRQLSPTEQLRLVKEEHAALTNSWIESRQSWCLCAHCKHRRMTISDLTDCLYQTYCEELEAFISSGGQGSTLYSPALTNSVEPAAKARRFLFKSLSVVGEQALLPRYNQFILKLEAFSSMAFSPHDGTSLDRHPSGKIKIPGLKSGLKSAALQASKEFLLKHGKNASAAAEEMAAEGFLMDPEYLRQLSRSFDSNCNLNGTLKANDVGYNDEDDEEDCILIDRNLNSGNASSDDEDDEGERDPHQGGIQSEDDDDLIDEETDLPLDESELMLPGGASFPLLPVGEGPVQWSESSRIECGRTVFLMFASEMFQYRLTAAYMDHQTRLHQAKMIAEIEAEERAEKAVLARLEREKKERAEQEKRKKAAKKEKLMAPKNKKNATTKTTSTVSIMKEVKPEDNNAYTDELKVENNNAYTDEVKVENNNTFTDEVSVVDEQEEAVHQPMQEQEAYPIQEQEYAQVQEYEQEQEQEQEISPSIQSPSSVQEIVEISPFSDHLEHCPNETSINDDDDDFDPTLLVELLSKEMNNFESANTKIPAAPPGFSSSVQGPPGFASSSEPKHLIDVDYSDSIPHFTHPPFHFNDNDDQDQDLFRDISKYRYENDELLGHHHQHVPPYASNNAPYNRNVQQQQQQHMHQEYRQYPHSYGYQQSPPHNQQPPPQYYYNQSTSPAPPEDGQSRFQSFFSKSIFGPSTFFK